MADDGKDQVPDDGDEPRPEDVEVKCSGGLALPRLGVSNGE